MTNNYATVWALIGAAVVGIASAAGTYIFQKHRQNKQQHLLNEHIAKLDNKFKYLDEEFEKMRKLEGNRHSIDSKRPRKKIKSTSSTVSTEDYKSAYDSSDLEYYDLSSEEDSSVDNEWKDMDKKLESENKTDVESVLDKLNTLTSQQPQNIDLLWRQAKACKILAIETNDPMEKRAYITRGIEACEMGIKVKPDSALCHKWMAILVGLKSEFLPIKEKIVSSYTFKKHCEIAIRLTPDDAFLHYLLGRYVYEIAELTWLERALAQTFFAELPSYSHEDAMNHFMKAEKLSDKEWKENRLYIAKCSLATGRTKNAIEWLNKAENADSIEEDKVHEEVKYLLEKHKQS